MDVADGRHRVVFVVVVATCVALAALINFAGSLVSAREILRACGRATLQLLAVSVVITAVLRSGALTAIFVLVMLTVAGGTAARRLTSNRSGAWAGLAVAVGVLPGGALTLATGLVPLRGVAVVPIAGILTGGAMTATALAGRRCLDALRIRHGEYEAALALGLSGRDAVLIVGRADAALALMPGLDQTRTVGLVTLPGAFVGMLLGGASPVAAAAVQLVVLVALLLVQTVAVWATVELIAGDRIRTDDRPR